MAVGGSSALFALCEGIESLFARPYRVYATHPYKRRQLHQLDEPATLSSSDFL